MAHKDRDIGHDMSAVMPTYGRSPLSFVRGQGAWLETDKGERYLDFGSGIAVNALGHAHPHLVEILKDQADKLWHVSNLYQIPSQQRLAERLTAHSFADTVFFCNSGAEAMEACVKTARKYHAHTGHPERYRIVTFEGAFHGRTLAMIAAGGQEKHLAGFGPKVEGFDQVAVGDRDAVKGAITPETAGILIEPIQGEGGIRMIDTAFLRFLRELCDEHGLLLLLDEVQTGVGRTGKLFAYEWSGIEPDIMGIAKGIGGGFPLGACLATAEAAQGMTAGSHGSTFGGNPMATAIGNGVLDIVLKDGFLAHVRAMGNRLAQGLSMLCDHYPDIVEDVRGQGLLAAVKCKIPNTEMIEALRAHKLLTVGAGDNVVRLIPPLIVSEKEIADALARLDAACAQLQDAHRKKPLDD